MAKSVSKRDAVRSAQTGATAWRQVVHGQRTATPSHSDFYELAAEMIDTLRALEAMTRVLGEQVRGYWRDRAVYDGTGTVDPRRRLVEAGRTLAGLQSDLARAERETNAFFSAIGHIGVEQTEPGGRR